jgi:hypothetical protein
MVKRSKVIWFYSRNFSLDILGLFIAYRIFLMERKGVRAGKYVTKISRDK